MTVNLKSLFRGIAVIIDDEVIKQESEIIQLASQIEKENCHVIKLPKLPTDEQLDTLAEAAFFILDWNLYDIQLEESGDTLLSIRKPSGLEASQIEDNIKFIKKIRERRFAPLFIFTNEVLESVKQILRQHNFLNEDPTDHIFVQGKAEVLGKGVFGILEEWIKGHPSAYVLKHWELAYANARNSFFVDFYENNHLWPAVFWKTYSEDNVSEAAEMTSLIGRNILSRLAPVSFDANIITDLDLNRIDTDDIQKVLEGERFIKNEKLQDHVSMGDVFKCGGKYFVNIRPECDCIARNGQTDEDIELYLLKGDRVKSDKISINETYGNIIDNDTESTIFAMYEGITVRFKFKNLCIKKWSEYKGKRIGRLIPPYSTKLQQRFASYLQRVGLSRIPSEAIPKKILSTEK